MTWHDPKLDVLFADAIEKSAATETNTINFVASPASLRAVQVLFHPALLGVLALQQLGQLDAKTKMCVAP